MSRLLRANFIRMFRSVEFMACALVSLALGVFNLLATCVWKAPSYQPTFEKDFFTMSIAVVVISAVFVSLFFGTENSVLRNKLIVGYSRGEVFSANCITAFGGVFIINALSMLPYALIAPLLGAELGELTADELMFNVMLEILAVLAAGGVYFLITVIISRRSVCTTVSMLSAIIMICLPELGGAAKYSPVGQLNTLLDRMYTSAVMPLYSLVIVAVTIIAGSAIFGRKNIK